MAIVKPDQMNFVGDNIIMVLSGLPGVGKTTVACSAPDVIVVDMDNGIKRVKSHHRKDAITVSNHEELLEDIKSPAFMKYKTVAIDTTGQFIESLKEWAYRTDPTARKKNGGFSQQGFGIVKSEFLRVSAELKKTHNVIYMFHVTKEKNKEETFFELMCEGSAKNLVWIPADLGAYLQIINGERMLCFTPTSEYSAKASYGIKGMYKVPELGDGDPNAFLTGLFAKAKENMAKEAEESQKSIAEYMKVMEQGKSAIEKVSDSKTAQEATKTINELPEVLTSKAELSSILKSKLQDVGLKWNKEKKQYE